MRSAEQHGCMTIVTAGMHFAGHRGSVGHVTDFLDRQSIHVGAQSNDSAVSPTAANDADDARAPDPGHDLVAAKASELIGDGGRGAVHVGKELGIGMYVASPGANSALHGGKAGGWRAQ